MDTFALISIGLFAGFIVCSKIGVALAVAVIEYKKALAIGQRTWPVFATLSVHSGPWLLLMTIVFITMFARTADPPLWGGLLLIGGLGGLVLYLAVVFWASLRFRARRRSKLQSGELPPPMPQPLRQV